MAMVLITHDLGIVAGVADRVAVMQAGQHRRARRGQIGFSSARSIAYTQALLRRRANARRSSADAAITDVGAAETPGIALPAIC